MSQLATWGKGWIVKGYIWRGVTKRATMLRVASRKASGRGNGPAAELLQDALDEQALGIRTLARKIASDNGGKVESWRAQIYKILGGQSPERFTAIKIARALGKDELYLVVNGDSPPDPKPTVRQLAEELRATTERVAELERRLSGSDDPGSSEEPAA
jgi:hypothetical protein